MSLVLLIPLHVLDHRLSLKCAVLCICNNPENIKVVTEKDYKPNFSCIQLLLALA